MIHRKLYSVTRPCHRCKGSGQGACLVRCHVCDGDGARKFKLYASDLEGATLITYIAPPIDATDPSMRVAPKRIEGERRVFMTASEAHEAGLTMLANGEIIGYGVQGWDDFAQLDDGTACEAWEELSFLDVACSEARKASEDVAWEERDNVLADLIRLGDVEIVDGVERLTPKGAKRLRAIEEQPDNTYARQCERLARRATYLAEKAAQ